MTGKSRDEPSLEPKKPRRWYNYWPLLLLLAETVLNTDWVITPILMKRGIFFNIPFIPIHWDLSWIIPRLSRFDIFICISIFSIPTTLGWYWLWGWIGRLIIETVVRKESVQEAMGIIRKTVITLKRGGVIELIRVWFIDTFN